MQGMSELGRGFRWERSFEIGSPEKKKKQRKRSSVKGKQGSEGGGKGLKQARFFFFPLLLPSFNQRNIRLLV